MPSDTKKYNQQQCQYPDNCQLKEYIAWFPTKDTKKSNIIITKSTNNKELDTIRFENYSSKIKELILTLLDLRKKKYNLYVGIYIDNKPVYSLACIEKSFSDRKEDSNFNKIYEFLSTTCMENSNIKSIDLIKNADYKETPYWTSEPRKYCSKCNITKNL